jgi:hypothetical protein
MVEAYDTGDFVRALDAADVLRMSGHRTEKAPLVFGIRGDGLRLGALLRSSDLSLGHADGHPERCRTLRLLAPSIHVGKEDLLRWIRAGRRPPAWECDVACQLAAWMQLAVAAEVLGDAALAAELRAVGERFHRALLRRDIAVPLAVLEAL